MSDVGANVVGGNPEGGDLEESVGNSVVPQMAGVQPGNVAHGVGGIQGEADPELQDVASSAHVQDQENPPVGEPVIPDVVQPEVNDPTRNLIFQMLNRMDQQHEARNADRAVISPPDFLQLVMMVRNMGTKPYLGGTDPFEADAWLHCLDRNFAATRCPDDFKTDVAIHYLERDASSWWSSVEPKFVTAKPTWPEFRAEFEKKYFPTEAKDKLEVQFLELKQGNRSVREYEAEFTKLRRYVRYGLGDETALIRRFLRGLRPELRSRLQVVEFTSLFQLMERAVNVEEGILDEQGDLVVAEATKTGGTPTESRLGSQPMASGRSNPRGRQNNQGRMRNARAGVRSPLSGGNRECYYCGKVGHFKMDCPRWKQREPRDLSHITCFVCGKPGHYANACPERFSPSSGKGKAVVGSGSYQHVEESPTKKHAPARVFNLELVADPKPVGPSKGPISGMLGFNLL